MKTYYWDVRLGRSVNKLTGALLSEVNEARVHPFTWYQTLVDLVIEIASNESETVDAFFPSDLFCIIQCSENYMPAKDNKDMGRISDNVFVHNLIGSRKTDIIEISKLNNNFESIAEIKVLGLP